MAVEIIAEVAQGFEGNPKLAKLLAQGAVGAGAEAVKYQLVFAEELCVKKYPYYDFFRSLEMENSAWMDIANFIRAKKRKIYFDIYGNKSLSLAKELGASGVKISTTDFYNQPLVELAIKSFKQVFISIAGVPLKELDELARRLKKARHATLMYGFQADPTPIEENNLSRIHEFKKRYPHLSLGFMDHTSGVSENAVYLPLMALALGVDCIEKHITLDPVLKLEDHISALEPARFERFVRLIRELEPALGSPALTLTAKEKEYKNKAGKVVVSARKIREGEVLTSGVLALKRVSTSGSPDSFRKISDVLGKKLKMDVSSDTPITKGLV